MGIEPSHISWKSWFKRSQIKWEKFPHRIYLNKLQNCNQTHQWFVVFIVLILLMCQTISHLSPTSSQVLLLCVFSDILGVTVRRTFIIPDPNLARQCTLLWQYEGGGSLRNSLKGNVTWKLQQSVLTNASLTRKCALQKVTTEKRSFFFFHEISHCSVFDKCFFDM